MIEVEETWALIQGFPDYAVSNYGQVKSLRFDRILKARVNSYGLHRVVLYRNKEPYDFYVHRLVAAAFIDGYIPELQVRHRDDDGSNNNVYNLRFRQGQRMGQLIKNPPQATMRRIMIVENGKVFRTVAECADYIGGHPSSIYRVIRGERPHHLGYTFRFIEEN